MESKITRFKFKEELTSENFNLRVDEVENALNNKSDPLKAGDNVKIENDTISAVDTIYDDTNIITKIQEVEEKIKNLDITYDDTALREEINRDLAQIKSDIEKLKQDPATGLDVTQITEYLSKVIDENARILAEFDQKATFDYVDNELIEKADKTAVNEELLKKVDKADYQTAINSKADKDTVFTKVEIEKLQTDLETKMNSNVEQVIGTAPDALNTLGKIADFLKDADNSVQTSIINSIKEKVDKGELQAYLTKNQIDELLKLKQNKLVAGENVRIDENNVITAGATPYKAGDNIKIDEDNTIHAVFVAPQPSVPVTPTDPTIPMPITDFSAMTVDGNSVLTWNKPNDEKIKAIKIIKNENRMPADLNDGIIIFNGDSEKYVDENITKGRYIYYRAFTYTKFNVYNADATQVTRTSIKINQDKPPIPEVVSTDINKIVLKRLSNMEYKVDDNEWQDSNTFKGLAGGKKYKFYQRYKGTDLKIESEISEPLIFEVPKTWILTAIIDSTNSNPESSVTYSDDALGMTPKSEEFDELFGYYPVMLKDGVEGKKLDPNNYAKYIDGTNADITSGDEGDVMVCFPRLGVRFQYKGDDLYVSLTNHPNAEGFQYYAHSRGNKALDKFYMGAYLGCAINGKLKSLSGKTATVNKTLSAFRTLAHVNGQGYELLCFYQISLLQAMYLIKYKNLDSQTALGKGYTASDNTGYLETGGTDTKGLNFGETTGKEQCKLFGIEDFYGNYWQFVDGVWKEQNGDAYTTTDNHKNGKNGKTKIGRVSLSGEGYKKKAIGTNDFCFIADDFSGSSTTYFCDLSRHSYKPLYVHGGRNSNNLDPGVFDYLWNQNQSVSYIYYNSRLTFY